MAWIDMQVAPIGVGSNRNFAYESSQELSSAGNGDWVLIPSDVRMITIVLIVDSGEGSVEITNSPVSVVKANVPKTITWDDGNVAISTQSAVLPVTAIRQVNISGTTTLELRAQ